MNVNQCFPFFGKPDGSWKREKVPEPANPSGFRTIGLEYFVEGFEFGWSVETTYDLFRRRALAMLAMARQQAPESFEAQSCLEASLSFLVSGLEALLKWVLSVKDARDTPTQNIAAYQKALKKRFGDRYRTLAGAAGQAVDRLFKVRHALIHNGGMATGSVVESVGGNIPLNLQLRFEAEEIEKLITQAVDKFVERIAEAMVEPSQPPDSSETGRA